MVDNSIVPFIFPAVERKKITAAFDGGRLTSKLCLNLGDGADQAALRGRDDLDGRESDTGDDLLGGSSVDPKFRRHLDQPALSILRFVATTIS
ncbi:hypothetical protein QA640_39220 [Bradyrhizobium sp. CB82]|uniref:hypothetical protein n=1 Tax=Bradyrhizobium sp. CB82 TaxID=3039159 RepID=UPI0024B0B6A0|nr:hypothetical protein [Bradyrhizobium sp. CB82]WFU45379.1 hypothetical protein QA640_39220 [Bradyrhizobium sp. CB82]